MRLPLDVTASLFMGACCVALLAAHRIAGAARYHRVAQQGGTFFLGLDLMHAGYWLLQPVVRGCARCGVSPTLVTWFSLAPALAAAVFAGLGHWGFAAWALLASALFDVLDGAVARETGLMSPSGAVLDSVLDRYAESIVFGGFLIYYHDDLPAQLVILGALVGSFFVSYSSAKAEALHLTPPRGSMKRSDRLALLVVGAALAPLSQFWLEPSADPFAWPVLGATSLIAVLANLSAIHRFTVLAREARVASAAAIDSAKSPAIPPRRHETVGIPRALVHAGRRSKR